MTERSDLSAISQGIRIFAGAAALEGDLGIPGGAEGLVIFAHGSGSSRLSPRNQSVARAIRQERIGTLLFDLLTREEETIEKHTAHLRFNIDLLAERLVTVSRWVSQQPRMSDLALGYFGSSSGAAAALVAASTLPSLVRAVVSRGGRPDLAERALPRVQAPTLLIVGERDEQVLRLNHDVCARLTCEKELSIVPGATHLFEEPGTLEQVAHLAARWFQMHLQGHGAKTSA